MLLLKFDTNPFVAIILNFLFNVLSFIMSFLGKYLLYNIKTYLDIESKFKKKTSPFEFFFSFKGLLLVCIDITILGFSMIAELLLEIIIASFVVLILHNL